MWVVPSRAHRRAARASVPPSAAATAAPTCGRPERAPGPPRRLRASAAPVPTTGSSEAPARTRATRRCAGPRGGRGRHACGGPPHARRGGCGEPGELLAAVVGGRRTGGGPAGPDPRRAGAGRRGVGVGSSARRWTELVGGSPLAGLAVLRLTAARVETRADGPGSVGGCSPTSSGRTSSTARSSRRCSSSRPRCSRVARYHRRKAHLVLSAMRHRAAELGDRAVLVRCGDLPRGPRPAGPRGAGLSVCDPTSYPPGASCPAGRPGLGRGAASPRVRGDRGGVRHGWAGRRPGQKRLLMEDFYREVRRHHRLLLSRRRRAARRRAGTTTTRTASRPEDAGPCDAPASASRGGPARTTSTRGA